ncbi:MAG: AAA family ATPase [Ignavibacteriota bacterium]
MRYTDGKVDIQSGGPGAGKTTVLRELAAIGFRHASEVARQIIQEQVSSAGKALPWADREAYSELMLQRSIESFEAHTPATDPLFADRGIPDTLAYARLIDMTDTGAIELACRRYRYAPLVFLFPPCRKSIRKTRSGNKTSPRRSAPTIAWPRFTASAATERSRYRGPHHAPVRNSSRSGSECIRWRLRTCSIDNRRNG